MLLLQDSCVVRMFIDSDNLSQTSTQKTRDQVLTHEAGAAGHNYFSQFCSGELRRQGKANSGG
jgi:hypothetical protein